MDWIPIRSTGAGEGCSFRSDDDVSRVVGLRDRLLINFNVVCLVDGARRVVRGYEERSLPSDGLPTMDWGVDNSAQVGR